MMHTTSDSGLAPSIIQRGLEEGDRDTIAYLAAVGAGDDLLRRVARTMVEAQRLRRVRVEVTDSLGLPSTARIWRDDVLIFDGVSRSALVVGGAS